MNHQASDPRTRAIYPPMAGADGMNNVHIATVYMPAKQFFDFCQWTIMATAFGGISLYFINRPVFAWEYWLCLAVAIVVTAISFWHLARAAHACVASLLAHLFARMAAPPGPRVMMAIAAPLDALVIAAFIHMLQIFAHNVIVEMAVLNN